MPVVLIRYYEHKITALSLFAEKALAQCNITFVSAYFVDFMKTSLYESVSVQFDASDWQHLNNFPNEIFKCFWYNSQCSNQSNKMNDKI